MLRTSRSLSLSILENLGVVCAAVAAKRTDLTSGVIKTCIKCIQTSYLTCRSVHTHGVYAKNGPKNIYHAIKLSEHVCSSLYST
jgi:hypothetical protein